MSEGKTENTIIRVAILGETAVGKTSILSRFLGEVFDPNYIATIGYGKLAKEVTLKSQRKLKLLLFDTAGQERYRSVAESTIKSSSGILLVFSVVDSDSFSKVSDWIKQIQEMAPENTPIVLCGNKIDLPNRVVTKEQAEEYAEKNNLTYFETSAKDGTGIEEAFQHIAERIGEIVPDKQVINITPRKNEKDGKGCCANKKK